MYIISSLIFRLMTKEPINPDAWEITKEVVTEGAEKAAKTLGYAKEEGGRQATRVWRKSQVAADKEGAEMAGDAWETVKEKSKEGAEKARRCLGDLEGCRNREDQ